jgi:hypothetical protein
MNKLSDRVHNIIGRMPHFYQSGEVNNHLFRMVNIFAQMVDKAEEDLLRVMRSHWADTANNENSKGLDATTKGDLDKILALFLQNLGGTSLLRQTNRPAVNSEEAEEEAEEEAIKAAKEADRAYRDRMKGLIQVILGGPSTKSGLIEIVSANLGILGDDAAARYARQQIQIREFLPEILTEVHSNTELLQRIAVFNPNPDALFADVTVKILSIEFPLIRPKLVHAGTGGYWQYNGLIVGNEELIFSRNGSLFHKGESGTTVTGGNGLLLHPGLSEFYLDAGIGTALGKFDETLFDYSLFEETKAFPLGIFDQGHFDDAVFVPTIPVANITVRLEKLLPASFSVMVPWDSAGYTAKYMLKSTLLPRLEAQNLLPGKTGERMEALLDKELDNTDALLTALSSLDEHEMDMAIQIVNEELEPTTDLFEGMSVNPRSQILYIVNKVKGAGIMAVVSYAKRFIETHSPEENFYLSGEMMPVVEDNDPYDENLIIASVQQPYPDGLDHQLSDGFILNGVFDYTGFDSLNAFA